MNGIANYEHPYVTVDGVILKASYTSSDSVRALKMKWDILLVQRENEPQKGSWSLPGGFLDIDKELDEALLGKVFQKTGMVDYYMEQLKTFGGLNRDERGRVITVAYIILINDYHGELPKNAKWFSIDNDMLVSNEENISFEELAFDHAEIIREALERIKGKIWYSDIASYMLTPEFTIKEAQDLYALAEGKRTDSFQRQLGNRICQVNDKHVDTKGRPAKLYRWNRHKGGN